jgi:hypothetical protein
MMPDEISCRRCREQLPEFAAETLPEAAHRETAHHLQACPSCSAELEMWRSVGQALRQTSVAPPLLTFEAAWGKLQAQLAASPASPATTQPLSDTWRGVSSVDHRPTTFLPDATGWPDEGPTNPRIPRSPAPQNRWRLVAACVAVLALVIASVGVFATIASQRGHAASRGSATTTASSDPVATHGVVTTPTGAIAIDVKIFFSRHPDSDNNPEDVFPVLRVAPNLQVATFAINQLISGPSAAERGKGYYTPLQGDFQGPSNCGGADFKITLNHRGTQSAPGTATLQFCRQLPLAGDLTGARITAEITSTLEQFSTIRRVVILTESGSCFNDFSGQNLCLGN